MKKIFSLIFLIPAVVYAGDTGTAVTVIDGRTIVVQLSNRSATVRLIGVDSVDGNSAEYLRRLVQGRTVSLQSEGDGAYVHRHPDGVLVNREMITAGFALASRSPSFGHQADFIAQEHLAKSQRRGRWSGQPFAVEWESRFNGVKYLGVAAPHDAPRKTVTKREKAPPKPKPKKRPGAKKP